MPEAQRDWPSSDNQRKANTYVVMRIHDSTEDRENSDNFNQTHDKNYDRLSSSLRLYCYLSRQTLVYKYTESSNQYWLLAQMHQCRIELQYRSSIIRGKMKLLSWLSSCKHNPLIVQFDRNSVAVEKRSNLVGVDRVGCRRIEKELGLWQHSTQTTDFTPRNDSLDDRRLRKK